MSGQQVWNRGGGFKQEHSRANVLIKVSCSPLKFPRGFRLSIVEADTPVRHSGKITYLDTRMGWTWKICVVLRMVGVNSAFG